MARNPKGRRGYFTGGRAKARPRAADLPPDTTQDAYAINVMLVEAAMRTNNAQEFGLLARQLGIMVPWLNSCVEFRARPTKAMVENGDWSHVLRDFAPFTWDETAFANAFQSLPPGDSSKTYVVNGWPRSLLEYFLIREKGRRFSNTHEAPIFGISRTEFRQFVEGARQPKPGMVAVNGWRTLLKNTYPAGWNEAAFDAWIFRQANVEQGQGRLQNEWKAACALVLDTYRSGVLKEDFAEAIGVPLNDLAAIEAGVAPRATVVNAAVRIDDFTHAAAATTGPISLLQKTLYALVPEVTPTGRKLRAGMSLGGLDIGRER